MRYPPAVQQHFDAPANVGPLRPAAQRTYRGEAGSMALGTWITFEADIVDGRLRRLAFQAFGCPYTIAACSRATEMLAAAPVEALSGFEPRAIAAEFGVPAERIGRLLILQDALRNCFRDWDTTQSAAAP
jgi:NifU-like protein involved in Fe-S cluster formation